MNQKIKISQLPAKGSNLAAQDLIEIAEFTGTGYISKSITGQEIIDAAVGNVDWGDIGGTLSAQTDLQNALDAKQDDITLTTTGSSGASTLVGSTLNVPNYTLSGLGGVPTSRTLTINGVTQDLSADRTFTISTGITIGSTAIASGTVGRILFEGAGNVVQESSSLFWDATNNRLGIGTSTPTNILTLNRNVNATDGIFVSNTNTGSLARTMLRFTNDASEIGQFSLFGSGTGVYANKTFFEATKDFVIGVDAGVASGGTSKFQVYVNGYNFAASPQFTINSTGNVLIGTTTDAGFRLDVNGTARVQDNLTLVKNQNAVTSLTVSNNNTGSSTGISSALQSDTSIGNSLLYGSGRINNNVNQYNTGASYIIDYQGPVGLNISSTFASSANSGIRFWTAAGTNNGVERMRIFSSTGNVGINTTTDAGFRLDVNGTARVNGNAQFGTAFYWDNTNQRVGIRTSSSGAALDIWNSSTNELAQYRISDNRVTIPNYSTTGFNPVLTTNTLGFFAPASSSTGGVQFSGFTSNINTESPFIFVAHHGGTSPTVAALRFVGFKHNGSTNRTALTGNEIIAGFSSGFNADVFQVKANGRINMSSLPTSSAGLSAGDIWNDAGTLKIV